MASASSVTGLTRILLRFHNVPNVRFNRAFIYSGFGPKPENRATEAMAPYWVSEEKFMPKFIIEREMPGVGGWPTPLSLAHRKHPAMSFAISVRKSNGLKAM